MGKTKRRSSSSSSQSSSRSSTDDGRRHRRRVKRLRKEVKFKNKFLEKQPMLIFLGLRTDTAAGWPNVMNLQTRHRFLMRHWYYRVAKGQGMRAVVSDERGAGRGERKNEKSVVFTTDVRGIFGQNILERRIEYRIIDPGRLILDRSVKKIAPYKEFRTGK
ncbi:unnamed protein product [Acanthoscelides obtectus]|uniref:Uncharacterized protein n=1 Tax=Acanthoscelides obtectus TaxID=200917 RepID=A0A9P0PZ28_ACAOB|nr:unnamed protein product [Acanthoscelides obtectus]CAK1641280.1 hypothetical protein AOBTE_LOCUS12298 [Acanthoscelides obtectus]